MKGHLGGVVSVEQNILCVQCWGGVGFRVRGLDSGVTSPAYCICMSSSCARTTRHDIDGDLLQSLNRGHESKVSCFTNRNCQPEMAGFYRVCV